jgi:hypothetical protein
MMTDLAVGIGFLELRILDTKRLQRLRVLSAEHSEDCRHEREVGIENRVRLAESGGPASGGIVSFSAPPITSPFRSTMASDWANAIGEALKSQQKGHRKSRDRD